MSGSLSQTPEAEQLQGAVWVKYSRDREFPLSAFASAALHLGVLAVVTLGLLSAIIGRQPNKDIPIEVIDFAPEGGGVGGADDNTRLGNHAVKDDVAAVDNLPRPMVTVPTAPLPEAQRPVEKPVIAEGDDDAITRQISRLPSLPKLSPLVRGLPQGKVGNTGSAGRGAGGDSGAGNKKGNTAGHANLTPQQARQLRWTILFSIRNAHDYIEQLRRMNVILGVQFQDRSIKFITNLGQRPARLEPGDRLPDRIFWVDDNVESIQAMIADLGISGDVWRIVAFFPDSIEQELLRKEKAFGAAYGRKSEEDIKETVFRVDDNFGQIRISVVRQEGKSK